MELTMPILRKYQVVSKLIFKHKLTSVLVSLVCVISISLFYFAYQNIVSVQKIEWVSRKSNNPKGSALYILKKDNSQERFFLATERVLGESNYSTEKGYHMELYHMDDYWNPNTCAKMPSLVTGEYIYTLEIFKNRKTGLVETSIIRFDIANKKIESFLIPQSELVIGSLFLHKGKPAIISYKKDKLYFSILENNSRRILVTKGFKVDPEDANPSIFLKQSIDMSAYIEYMKPSLQKEVYTFNPEKLEFIKTKGVQERERIFFNKQHKDVLSKYSDILFYYNLSSVADINIYDDSGNKIIIWNNPIEEMSKFIIGTI
jgi:hypothetical protein